MLKNRPLSAVRIYATHMGAVSSINNLKTLPILTTGDQLNVE